VDAIAALRSFNRSFTTRVGVLSDSYLGGGRPLGPARLLFELGAGPERVGELRRRLGLDSGYLSRMLRGLEADGLVVVERDQSDGRRRVARLTGSGRREWRRLDQCSERAAAMLTDALSPSQRTRLADALGIADHLLRVASIRFEPVDIASPAARHATSAYFAELDQRFSDGFDPGPGLVASDAAMMRPPHGGFLVARNDEEVIGCGGVQRVDEATAEIKRMWIHQDWRGDGLGTRLLVALEAMAAKRGHRRVVLDTNRALTEAIRLYGRCGYDAIPRYNDNPYAHHWFAKDLPAGTS
jgi:DNA-binding MarR family transcriptional regulator/GNAT superfamily N-acetyltransferase